MPDSGLFELLGITGGTGAVRSDDVLPLVDVHDSTQAAQGSTVKITVAQLYRTDTTAVTVSTPLPDIAQKWNAAGVTFTAVKLNVTDTASAAGSLLLDLQVGTVSKWSVTKAGATTQASTLTVTAGGVTVSAGTTAVQALTAAGGAAVSGGDFSSESGVSKTGGAGSYVCRLLKSTGDGTTFEQIIVSYTGNATASLRAFTIQTSEATVNNLGILKIQPFGGTVELASAGAATTVMGTLVLSTAVGKIIPGATSISHRNNADSADNLIITDAGAVTIRSTLAIGGALSGVTTLNASGLATLGAGIALTGSLTFATAASLVIPGSTSITFRNNANSANNLSISDAGAVTIRSSVTVNAGLLTAVDIAMTAPTAIATSSGSTFPHNESGVGAGTLSNAPSAGNPSKWLAISDNGTTRYVPTWIF